MTGTPLRFVAWIGVGLSIGLLVLWGLSVPFRIGYVSKGDSVCFGVGLGFVGAGRELGYTANTPGKWYFSPIPRSWVHTWGWSYILGFRRPYFERWDYTPNHAYRGVQCGIPIWMLLAPTVVLSVLCFRRAAIRARQSTGNCPDCNYDLRGNVSGVCPECGAMLRRRAKKNERAASYSSGEG